jgi:hypothetical protein
MVAGTTHGLRKIKDFGRKGGAGYQHIVTE